MNAEADRPGLFPPGYFPLGLFPPAAEEPRIVLQWLVRLRWLALAGQATATLIAVVFLKIKLPLSGVGSIIALTGLSNLALQAWTRRRVPTWLVPTVLMLDVFLLTALLLCSGGPSNPFTVLYLVHVAMAVATLAEAWSWMVVAATTACYGLLFLWPSGKIQPLTLTPLVGDSADCIALILVAIVIAYFVGRTRRSLRAHSKALADARERAARNEQLAALTTLAAGAAHELNTPLSTIAVIAKELEVQSRQMDLGDAFVKDSQLIRQEVDRCQYIIARLRADVLHGDAPKSEPILAADLVRGLCEGLKSVAGTNLRIECAPDVQQVMLPFRAVQQALGILVDNAVEASTHGSPVSLSIYNRNGHVVFEVNDQGTGMSPEVVRRAGEPFFTTKPPGEGMGLGLFLVRLVAEKLGGSLGLESEQGKGTRAMLELPRV